MLTKASTEEGLDDRRMLSVGSAGICSIVAASMALRWAHPARSRPEYVSDSTPHDGGKIRSGVELHFDDYQLHALIKHPVLDAYLKPWRPSWLHSFRRIWCVDAFAGHGQAGVGNLGSP